LVKYLYKDCWRKRYALLPKCAKNGDTLWLVHYYEYIQYYDWPPKKIRNKTIYTEAEGIVAMLKT
jgi:hypothetical protein|tara:strand:- start:3860 stop:4054 length:195 start_codon:yes stop_codon:yes gene_type:complete